MNIYCLIFSWTCVHFIFTFSYNYKIVLTHVVFSCQSAELMSWISWDALWLVEWYLFCCVVLEIYSTVNRYLILWMNSNLIFDEYHNTGYSPLSDQVLVNVTLLDTMIIPKNMHSNIPPIQQLITFMLINTRNKKYVTWLSWWVEIKEHWH